MMFIFMIFTNAKEWTAVAEWLRRCATIRSQLVSLEFFIDINFPIALWPWCRLSL